MSRKPEATTQPQVHTWHHESEARLQITQTLIEDPSVIDAVLSRLADTVGLDRAQVAHTVVYQNNYGTLEIFCITTENKLQVFSHIDGKWTMGWHDTHASRLLYNASLVYPDYFNPRYNEYYLVCMSSPTEVTEATQLIRHAYIMSFLQKIFLSVPTEVISETAANVQLVAVEHTRTHDYRKA